MKNENVPESLTVVKWLELARFLRVDLQELMTMETRETFSAVGREIDRRHPGRRYWFEAMKKMG